MIPHVVNIFNLVNFIFLEPLFRVPEIESKYDMTTIIATQRRCPVALHSMDSIIFTRDYPPVYSRISSPPAILSVNCHPPNYIFFSDKIFLLRVYQRTGLFCSGAPAAKIYRVSGLSCPEAGGCKSAIL